MENSHFAEMNSGFQGPYVDYYHLLMEMMHLVDIWNMIEAFRENGLNSLEPRMEINVPRLEALVSSIYYQLNKRLSASQQLDIDQSSSLLLSWLLATYDPEESGKVHVFSVKIALATLSTGKLTDKLRYIFSLISDANGHLIYNKFSDFLKEVLALPCSVFESPSFSYDDNLAGTIFDKQTRVTVNDFLDALMSDPGPQCLTWLPLLHRMANVENELHPVQCDGCNRESFLGFRYKCQRCYNYQLCQDCFWRGRVSGSHTNQHEMKEYTTYKPPSKQISHSLRKSFKCVPEKQTNQLPRFPDEPERPLNLQHIIPPSPLPSHNGFHDPLGHSFDMSSLDSRSTSKSPLHQTSSLESSRDDEHRLIVRYAARLADSRGGSVRSPSELSISMDSSRQKDLILQLEAKNREIMKEIIRLRKQQEQEDAALQSEQNPTLLAELRALRQHKEELETHLSALQESRRELMVQLESLMKLLKIKTKEKTSRHPSGCKVKRLTNHDKETDALREKVTKGESKMNHQASPRSTPNSSPRSGTSKSPPLSTPYPLSSSRSAPTTPGSGAPTTDSLTGVGGDVRMAFGQTGSTRSLRNDLLVAADSVTNAMSSLVRELNSGSEDEDGGADSKVLSSSRDFETEDTESAVESLEGGGTLWREERQRKQENEFLAEIRARNKSSMTASTIKESNETTTKSVKGTTETENSELYDNDPKKGSS